ncbi:flagellin [Lawsonibacter sp. DFI.6.74]|nr:flagellin [Lawsonibacter sp. DFI.6.74]MCG4773470.1 flagellin [Lawsonibacter sp. DFI.5.51]
MRIQHNIMAMNAYRNYNNNTSALSKNLEKLSSGYKINRAGDDAAGLAISEKMRAQITGLKAASKNVKDGVSLVKTAEGALQEVHDMLNRMDSLATQSANGTYDDAVDRDNLQKEVNALTKEIDRIADSANFNGIKLLDGSMGKATGVPTTYLSVGDDLGKAMVTKLSGATLGTDETVAITDGTDGTISVQITNDDGSAKTTKLKLADIISFTSGADAGKTLTAAGKVALAKGDTGVIDLSSVGLGRIEFTATDAVGDVKTLGAKLADIAGKGTAPAAGAAGGGLDLQIGDTADKFNKLTISVGDMHAAALGIGALSIAKQGDAAAAIDSIKKAINTVSSTRGDLGAAQNRLEHTQNNLSVMTENIQDAESTIRDTDVADEMMAYTKNNILVQSAQAMLAQANQVPQGVLQLLQ